MTPPLVGYYAGGWIWPEEQLDWVKSMLPFFNKLSLILPPELVPRAIEDNDVIAQPLLDMGILETRNPTDVFDKNATTQIVDTAPDRAERDRLLQGRQEELRDSAETLRSRARRDGLKTGLTVSLGLVGAALTFATGPIAGGVVAALSVASGLIPSGSVESPYTYLFKVAHS